VGPSDANSGAASAVFTERLLRLAHYGLQTVGVVAISCSWCIGTALIATVYRPPLAPGATGGDVGEHRETADPYRHTQGVWECTQAPWIDPGGETRRPVQAIQRTCSMLSKSCNYGTRNQPNKTVGTRGWTADYRYSTSRPVDTVTSRRYFHDKYKFRSA
jgi:hypothetical protein